MSFLLGFGLFSGANLLLVSGSVAICLGPRNPTTTKSIRRGFFETLRRWKVSTTSRMSHQLFACPFFSLLCATVALKMISMISGMIEKLAAKVYKNCWRTSIRREVESVTRKSRWFHTWFWFDLKFFSFYQTLFHHILWNKATKKPLPDLWCLKHVETIQNNLPLGWW